MKEIISEQQKKAILKSLEDAIKKGPWEKSNFLRAICKSLQAIHDNFENKINERSQKQIKEEAHEASRFSLRSDQQEVFVSLYSLDGANIQSWEKIISNLPGQMISRPIYLKEEQVISFLKTKENKENEAYVAIFINKSDIINLPPDKAIIDKLGNPLLSLKDKTLDLNNISRFVHSSGVYKYKGNHLIKE